MVSERNGMDPVFTDVDARAGELSIALRLRPAIRCASEPNHYSLTTRPTPIHDPFLNEGASLHFEL